MSARTLLRPASTSARVAATSLRGARALSSSAPRRGNDNYQQHHHGATSGPDDTETHESWFTPPWRNTFIITAIGILAWPYLPTPDRTPASPHTSPSEFQRIKSDPNTPWITRKWASMMEDPQTLLKKNDEHIDDSMRLAESRLSIQDAERPAVSRIRNRHVFDQASPFGVAVGTQVDVSEVRSL